MRARIALASAVSALAIAATPASAHNVPEGQCLPRDQMVARMQAEGQRVLVTSVAMTDAAMEPLAAAIAYSFSANADGSEGYELTTEEGGAMLCVRQHLTNVRIADPSRQQVRPFYMAGSLSDEEAREIGRQEGATYVGHNSTLDVAASNNAYPVLHARSRQGRGIMYLVAWPARSTGFMFQGDSRGLVALRHYLTDVTLTAHGEGLVADEALWPRRD